MDLKLKEPKSSAASHITITLPVPVSYEMYEDMKVLKDKYGKEVNEKIREFLRDLIQQNLEKAG